MNWLNRIVEYYKDKELADKCGLKVKDICVHEPTQIPDKIGTEHIIDGRTYTVTDYYCKKCGEFYR